MRLMADKTSGLAPVAIAEVAFGVRYEPQFKVFDYLGELLDEVLRADGTPFGPDVFSQSQTDGNERLLVSPEKKRFLRLNQQDTILVWELDTRKLDDVLALAKDFHEYVLTPLRKGTDVSSIQRYGMMLRLKKLTGLKNPPLARYLSQDFTTSSLTTLAMHFTRRLPAHEALWRKNVDDFRNVIYIVEEAEKGETQFSVDYQEYFKPPLDRTDWNKRPFTDFSEQALNYFEQEVSKWLKSFTDNSAAVA
jgi:hypothetical protein